MLPIQERFQQAYTERPDFLALVAEETVTAYKLSPPEIKVLCAALLVEDGDIYKALELTGLDTDLFKMGLQSLRKKGLATYSAGKIGVEPMQRTLRVQTPEEVLTLDKLEPPPVKLVPRSLREVVISMARGGKTPAAGLGAVYSFVFGEVPLGRDYGMLGKIANTLGVDKAALLMLERATWAFDQNPLSVLIAMAQARSTEWRPEDAPDVEEQRTEYQAIERASWVARMKRWLVLGGSYAQVEEATLRAHAAGELSAEQNRADQRQARIDFDRWEAEGRPPIE